MFLLRRRSKRTSRGQALVETALVLPILALLMVMALDFGRVFFGWIALQNAARIGADFAAQTAKAWDGTPDGEEINQQNRYVQLVEADLDALNCTLGGGGVIPDPTFEDRDGNGVRFDDGDYAVVSLQCSFGLITPLAENILGGAVALGASEKFTINQRIVQGVPSAPPVPASCTLPLIEVPDLVGKTMSVAKADWVAAGFNATKYLPPVVTTGPPGGRNGTKVVLTQSLDEDDCANPVTATITVTHTP